MKTKGFLVMNLHFEVNQFNFEDKGGVLGYDSWDAGCTISIVRRANKVCLLSFLELNDSFVPTSDYLAHADLELYRLVAVDA